MYHSYIYIYIYIYSILPVLNDMEIALFGNVQFNFNFVTNTL